MISSRRDEIRTAPNGRHRRAAAERHLGSGFVLPALAIVAFLYFSRPVLLPLFLACILSMVFKPVIQWCARWHIPPTVSTSLIAIIFLCAASATFYNIARPTVQWVNRAPSALQDLQQKAERFLHLNDGVKASEGGSQDTTAPSPVHLPNYDASTIIAWTGATLTGIIETVVMLFLILISHGWFSNKLAACLAPRYDRHWVLESVNELQQQISRYLLSITVINVVFGIIIASGVALIGLPNALMWGAMATFLNFIPYFGPIVGMAIIAVAGLLTFNSFPQEILPLTLYLGLHLLEADLFTPSILGNRFTIHPLIIFVALTFWTWLWGVPGAFLAVPILVALKVAGERVPQFSVVGELLRK